MENKSVNQINDIVILNGEIEDNCVFYYIDLEKYDQKDLDEIVNRFVFIKEKNPYDFRIIIEAEFHNFSDDDFAFFIALESKLKEHDLSLFFNGGYKNDYLLSELLSADTALDKFIDHINKPELSPFEKYLLIYNFLSNKGYKAEDVLGEDVHQARDIISIMNSHYIVCEGYANLMKYLCDNVGIPCINQILGLGKNSDRHMNNLVYLDDDKYKIHGLYYSDVTWDNVASTGGKKEYAFCLLPLDDIIHIKTTITIDPFFLMFYDTRTASIRVIDSDIENFVGYYENPNFQVKSFAESLFPIAQLVKQSYETAMSLLLENRIYAIHILRTILKSKHAPCDVYERNCFVPHGSSLPFLLAALCFNKKTTSLVEHGVDRLLKHIVKPLNEEGGPFEGETFPFFRNADVYLTLDLLEELKDEDINKPFDELNMISSQRRELEFNPKKNYTDWVVNKNLYEVILQTIHKLRNMILYQPISKLIKETYPKGDAIALNKFKTALIKTLEYEGNSYEESLIKVEEIIANTQNMAKKAFTKEANNCFRKDS